MPLLVYFSRKKTSYLTQNKFILYISNHIKDEVKKMTDTQKTILSKVINAIIVAIGTIAGIVLGQN